MAGLAKEDRGEDVRNRMVGEEPLLSATYHNAI